MKSQYTPTTIDLDNATCQAHEGRTHVTIDRIRAALVRITGKQLINCTSISHFVDVALMPHPTINNGYTFK